MTPYVVTIVAIFLSVGAAVWMLSGKKKDSDEPTRKKAKKAEAPAPAPAEEPEAKKGAKKPQQPSLKSLQKNAKAMTQSALSGDTKATSHPTFAANIKGCNNEVTAAAWSADGQSLVVSCV